MLDRAQNIDVLFMSLVWKWIGQGLIFTTPILTFPALFPIDQAELNKSS